MIFKAHYVPPNQLDKGRSMRMSLLLSAVLVSGLTSIQALACVTRAQYDKQVVVLQAELKQSYDAADVAFNEGVNAAAALRDEKLNALPPSDKSGQRYTAVINEYNQTVGEDGPLMQEWNASVAAAQARFTAAAKAATDAYNANPCN